MLVSANIFQPLIDVFETVLKFFHGTVGLGWGFSIVLMTISIRALLIPLTLKQFGAMRRMQAHAPELKAIKDKYKDDKQRQQQEMMKFHKENDIPYLASCLPTAAQLPVFISLFYMLRQDLRKNICPTIQTQAHTLHHLAAGQTVPCGRVSGSGFLFIHDLTNVAKGSTLVALIVLYVGTQLVSTILMQQPTMEKNQRRLMMFLPLLFVAFVINFPAGLLLYWITTNSWTIVQQGVIRRRIGMVVPVVAPAGGSVASPAGGRGGAAPAPAENGNGNGNGAGNGLGSGLGALLRGRQKEEPQPALAGRTVRTAAPPPSPRKKKKRSGRRR